MYRRDSGLDSQMGPKVQSNTLLKQIVFKVNISFRQQTYTLQNLECHLSKQTHLYHRQCLFSY